MMCSHVIFFGGNAEFEEVVKRLKEKLEVGSEEIGEFKYIGVEIRQENYKVEMSQRQYSKSMIC